jgi:hypothetical protein
MWNLEDGWKKHQNDLNRNNALEKEIKYYSNNADVFRIYNDYYIFDKIRDNGWYYDGAEWIQDKNDIRDWDKEWIEFNNHPVSKSVDKQQQLKLKLIQKHGNMNKQNKQRLHELEEKYMSYRYPSAPGHIIPFTKYSDATANGLTKCITDFLNYSKHQAERINTMGVFRQSYRTDGTKTAGQWTKGTGTPGSADISATIYGRSVKIEVKIGKDKQSVVQKEYQLMIEAAGGIYIISKTFDDFVEWYDNFSQNYKN